MPDVFCDIDVPDWQVKDCGTERAGIIAMLLVDVDENPSDANLASATFIKARIAASPQSYFLIQPTRGEYPGATPTEEDGFGTVLTNITGADHAATVEVEGIKLNRNFFEGVNRKKWKVGFFTNAGLLLFVQAPCSVFGKISNAKSIKAGAFWSIEIKWTDMSNPRVIDTPDNLLLTD